MKGSRKEPEISSETNLEMEREARLVGTSE